MYKNIFAVSLIALAVAGCSSGSTTSAPVDDGESAAPVNTPDTTPDNTPGTVVDDGTFPNGWWIYTHAIPEITVSTKVMGTFAFVVEENGSLELELINRRDNDLDGVVDCDVDTIFMVDNNGDTFVDQKFLGTTDIAVGADGPEEMVITTTNFPAGVQTTEYFTFLGETFFEDGVQEHLADFLTTPYCD